jgi:hypothetical protein
VIVVNTPHNATLEERGAFKLGDVPEGKGKLKVWAHGRWIHEQPIEITGQALDLQVKVAGATSKEPE